MSLPLAATFLLVAFGSTGFAQIAPRLTLVSPAPNAIVASAATAIVFDSTEPLDPLTIDGSVRVFGRWSGPMAGVKRLEGAQRIVFEPARAFFPGETVIVRVSAALRSQAGLALAGGFNASFWIGWARGSGTFALAFTLPVRRPGEGLVQTYGVYAGDLDGDGAPDLSAVNETGGNVRVFKNDGCGGYAPFVNHPLPIGSRPSPNEGADLNGDGITDLALGDTAGNAISILIGNGSGGFLPHTTYPSGSGTRGLCVLDVEGDGDIDVVTANRTSSNLALHRNLGNGAFAAAQLFEGGGSAETAIAAGDANGDGFEDLWVGHYTSNRVTLLRNDGTGVFTSAASATVGSRPWMIVLGDIDGDGDLDAATCDSAASRVSIVRGNGAGGFDAVSSAASGSFPLAIDLGDLDGDGDLDIVASNYGAASFTVWRNSGAGVFSSRQDLPASRAGSCAVLVDDDRDGDVDLIGIDEVDDLLFFYRQTGPSPSGVQPASCSAKLRIDGSAQRNGYGATAPLELRAGRTHFVEVSGGPGQACAVFLGLPSASPLGTAFGLWHLDPLSTFVLLAAALDADGEISAAVFVPDVPAPSAPFVLQGIVFGTAGPVLTNPEQAIARS